MICSVRTTISAAIAQWAVLIASASGIPDSMLRAISELLSRLPLLLLRVRPCYLLRPASRISAKRDDYPRLIHAPGIQVQGEIDTVLLTNTQTAILHKMAKIALPGKRSYSLGLDSRSSVM